MPFTDVYQLECEYCGKSYSGVNQKQVAMADRLHQKVVHGVKAITPTKGILRHYETKNAEFNSQWAKSIDHRAKAQENEIQSKRKIVKRSVKPVSGVVIESIPQIYQESTLLIDN